MYDASLDGKLKALWLMGEDLVQTDPNTNKVIKAAHEKLDLLVVQELFMTETCQIRHGGVCRALLSSKKAAPSPTASAESNA